MLISVEKIASGGLGLAHMQDGKTIFLPGTLPGEEVFCSKIKDKKSYLEGEDIKIIKSSPLRVDPACPYSNICGGCDFDYVSPSTSATLKEEIVKDNLKRVGKLETLPPFLPPSFSPTGEKCRSRVRVHVSLKERKVGFLRAKSDTLIPIKHCLRLEDKLNEVLENGEEFVRSSFSRIISKGVNKKTSLVEVNLFASDDKVLIESDEGIRTIDNIPYHVRGDVFFQNAPSLLPSLFTFVKENTVGERVMDLYSGVGTFSALFEKSDKHVIAVERQKECLALAKKNAPSAISYTGAVELWGKQNKEKVDTVIVDPPRVGLDKGVPQMISEWNPKRIIYVSCNSVTLSRDIPLFTSYLPIKAKLFDFYPGSAHEESAVVLERK